jgi:putative DNA primase/helicase
LFDIDGKHYANQFIYPDKITLPNGEKTDKLTKGKMSGCLNVAGDIAKSETIYIAEGAATADTVHLATDKPCVFCVNAGNIESVFLALKGKFQDKKFILIADNDLKKEAEKGINKVSAQ